MKVLYACLVALAAVFNSAIARTNQGNAVVPAENELQWWQYIDQDRRDRLSSLFEPTWFDALSETERISYCYVAQSLYDFLATGIDSHAHDHYTGFAPLLLRASFHAAGSFHAPTGTGGTNGGTIFSQGELEDGGNPCINKATSALEQLFRGSHTVSLADAMVIAGSVALDTMGYPRMDLIQITGGRKDVVGLGYRNRLPSPDNSPLRLFQESYDLTLAELTALVGGAHNFGSAHGVCSGYVGQWTSDPLNWNSPTTGRPEFFVDLMKNDWRWYETCTFRNGTTVFTSIESPFIDGFVFEEQEHDEEHEPAECSLEHNEVPFVCEKQAMRGCDFEDGAYGPLDSPCDVNLLQMRLRSDFFLKEDPILKPYAAMYFEDDELLAEDFGVAYHKLTHAGLDRCGLSGFGCGEYGKCEDVVDSSTGEYVVSHCVIDSELVEESIQRNIENLASRYDDDSDDDWQLDMAGSIFALAIIGALLVAVVLLTRHAWTLRNGRRRDPESHRRLISLKGDAEAKVGSTDESKGVWTKDQGSSYDDDDEVECEIVFPSPPSFENIEDEIAKISLQEDDGDDDSNSYHSGLKSLMVGDIGTSDGPPVFTTDDVNEKL